MDQTRAKDITSSLEMVDVTYHGEKIYIQTIDLEKNTARVHPLEESELVQEVLIDELLEQ